MFKEIPTPGYQYKVVRGDRLDTIEQRAYGSVKGILEKANPFLSGRVISLENRPTIYSGDVLNIPVIPVFRELKTERKKAQFSGKGKNELTILINDREIKYQSARLVRTIDTAADGFTASILWNPGIDSDLDDIILHPDSFADVQIYIGNELQLTGSIYGISPSKSSSGITIDIEGFSYTADAIDSTVPSPFEENNITPQDRANGMLQNIGIRAIFDFDPGGPFDRLTADITDTIFNHLKDMISQRGGLISSNPDGNMLFTRAKITEPVGTIQDDNTIITSISGKFDGRSVYNSITAFGESPGNPSKNATITDDQIPKSRFLAFKADDTTDGDIQKAAEWKRAEIYAKSLNCQLPVVGWYAPNGSLWSVNTILTVISPILFCPNGFDFLISQVEFLSENNGLTSNLTLVPPSVYTGGELVLPWR